MIKTNKMKSLLYLAFAAITAFTLGSCKKDELTAFKAAAAVNFTGTTSEYSFLGNGTGQYIQEVPVRLIGDTVNYDRHFSATVVNDTFTTAPTSQYEILGGVIKAGKFDGTLSVKVLNAPELSVKTNSLKVKLADSEDLRAGNIETNTFVIKWSNKVVIPSWTYYRVFFSSVSSTAVYKLIVQVTGMTTFTRVQFTAMQQAGGEAIGRVFGDYVKQWNKDHPNDQLKHDDGASAGQAIVPVYYTKSKFD